MDEVGRNYIRLLKTPSYPSSNHHCIVPTTNPAHHQSKTFLLHQITQPAHEDEHVRCCSSSQTHSRSYLQYIMPGLVFYLQRTKTTDLSSENKACNRKDGTHSTSTMRNDSTDRIKSAPANRFLYTELNTALKNIHSY